MSASDQEEVTETPEPGPVSGAKGELTADLPAVADDPADDPADNGTDDLDDSGADGHDEPDDGHDDSALTPRQARRIRVVVASVLLVTMAALLAVRLANRSSVLVVGLYGFAMILCGVVIELSRNGRTRLATWVLGFGLAGTLATDWLLLP
ncbi:hypothetical protein ACFT9I_03065 [Streptomyces sp. NPDC057137]|uniref:hypothetical protein n=1 Tax=Streptomyces sp. NPDC057137 TaxID=3346030 RepID=UPI00363196E3